MSEQKKPCAASTSKASTSKASTSKASTASKTKRPSTVNAIPPASRARATSSAVKNKNPPSRVKINKNAIISCDADLADATVPKQDPFVQRLDAMKRQLAYGKFLRAMLEECLLDEKMEKEEKKMEQQMVQLTERYQKTLNVMDKTNQRLKAVTSVVEQKRLLDLIKQDSNRFYEATDSSNAQQLLENLATAEKACLNKLETRNIDFGYDKDSGHKQLLDAVNQTITGLDDIKKHCNLDPSKFKEYEKSQKTLNDLEKDKMDLETLKVDFENKFPKFSEKVIKETAEKIAECFDDDSDD